jgi:hypothetical protein
MYKINGREAGKVVGFIRYWEASPYVEDLRAIQKTNIVCLSIKTGYHPDGMKDGC